MLTSDQESLIMYTFSVKSNILYVFIRHIERSQSTNETMM